MCAKCVSPERCISVLTVQNDDGGACLTTAHVTSHDIGRYFILKGGSQFGSSAFGKGENTDGTSNVNFTASSSSVRTNCL